MEITRRQFINAACASAVLAVSGGLTASYGQLKGGKSGLFPVPPEAYSDPLFSCTASQCRELIGHTFTVTREGLRPTSLILRQVIVNERSGNTLRGYYGDCFSLIFEGDGRRQLNQDSYLMETEGLRQFSALLVPVGIERTKYELIVNHITR